MKTLSSVVIAALLAANLSAQAQQRPYQERGTAAQPKAVGGPLKVIYRVSGVRNTNGGDSSGVATTFHCTSASAVDETLRIGVRTSFGALAGLQQTVRIAPNQTLTISTHGTNIFPENYFLTEGISIDQGSAHIMATSNKIFCSAMMVDAAASVPQGIALHMVRFDPALGSQE